MRDISVSLSSREGKKILSLLFLSSSGKKGKRRGGRMVT